jgi:rSAM/selenodomain-associated transferase 2
MLSVSVIIPTLNEAENLPVLLRHLASIDDGSLREIIVVDAHSSDDTVHVARQLGATVLLAKCCGRAAQMNQGAAFATGEVLQFIHADTRPPRSNFADIRETIAAGNPIGCFTYRFDSNNPLLRINGWFTRLDRLWCRGGDQAIFVKKDFFHQLGGYKQHWKIMEEYDLLIRARRIAPFHIVRKDGIVSARKYQGRNYLKVQLANLIVFNMFKRGYSQEKLVRTYRRLLG